MKSRLDESAKPLGNEEHHLNYTGIGVSLERSSVLRRDAGQRDHAEWRRLAEIKPADLLRELASSARLPKLWLALHFS